MIIAARELRNCQRRKERNITEKVDKFVKGKGKSRRERKEKEKECEIISKEWEVEEKELRIRANLEVKNERLSEGKT